MLGKSMTGILSLVAVGVLSACADDLPTDAPTQSAAGPPSVSLAGFVPGGGGLNVHDGNTIHACAKQQGGDLRLVSDAGSCLPSEMAVSWNIQGPQGPPGVVGAHIRSASETSTETFFAVIAQCEQGEIATGGGFFMAGPALSFAQLRNSGPIAQLGGDVPTAWYAAVNKPGTDEELTLSADVICVPVGGE